MVGLTPHLVHVATVTPTTGSGGGGPVSVGAVVVIAVGALIIAIVTFRNRK